MGVAEPISTLKRRDQRLWVMSLFKREPLLWKENQQGVLRERLFAPKMVSASVVRRSKLDLGRLLVDLGLQCSVVLPKWLENMV
jgi:hypothetical protein